MELKRSGFNDNDIQAHENELRQNSAVSTARALKEHFILERIAEEEKIEAVDADYDHEISLDRRPKRRIAAAHSRTNRKKRQHGRSAKPDYRTQGHRPHTRSGHFQGSAIRVRAHPRSRPSIKPLAANTAIYPRPNRNRTNRPKADSRRKKDTKGLRGQGLTDNFTKPLEVSNH